MDPKVSIPGGVSLLGCFHGDGPVSSVGAGFLVCGFADEERQHQRNQ